jgi:hypothetical protein
MEAGSTPRSRRSRLKLTRGRAGLLAGVLLGVPLVGISVEHRVTPLLLGRLLEAALPGASVDVRSMDLRGLRRVVFVGVSVRFAGLPDAFTVDSVSLSFRVPELLAARRRVRELTLYRPRAEVHRVGGGWPAFDGGGGGTRDRTPGVV